jgi:NADH-quinone oxidoreductase subunit L
MGESSEALEQIAVTCSALMGIGLAAILFLPRTSIVDRLVGTSAGRLVVPLWQAGWGFDRLYDRVIVQPWLSLTSEADELLDRCSEVLVRGAESCHAWLSHSQTGHVRWYAATVAVGTLVLLGLFAL